MAPWIVIIIVAREFIISGFRLIAAENGRVIAAGIWGKAKTVVQMIMCILLIMDVSALSVVTTIAIYAALILTIISLVDYIVHNLDVLSDQVRKIRGLIYYENQFNHPRDCSRTYDKRQSDRICIYDDI